MDIALKAYLVRAVYEYCVDHGIKPYVVAMGEGNPTIPADSLQEGKVTLNLSPSSIRELVIEDSYMAFTTRFQGDIHYVKIEIGEIVWIGSPGSNCGVSLPVISETDEKPETTRVKGSAGLRLV